MCSDARFASDIEKGREKEEVFINFCNKNNIACNDLADKHLGYDFIIGKKDTRLDVKSAIYGAGAIVIETKSSKTQNNKGWWYSATHADTYVFIDKVEDDVYVMYSFKRKHIREYMDFYKCTKEMTIGNGKGIYLKVNSKNKYNNDKLSIVEWVRQNYNMKNTELYVHGDGSLCNIA